MSTRGKQVSHRSEYGVRHVKNSWVRIQITCGSTRVMPYLYFRRQLYDHVVMDLFASRNLIWQYTSDGSSSTCGIGSNTSLNSSFRASPFCCSLSTAAKISTLSLTAPI